MADEKTDNGEKSVIKGRSEAHGLQVRTNTRLREKYFVDEKNIVASVHKLAFKTEHRFAKVIKEAAHKVASKPVAIRCATAGPIGEIQVDVVRDGARITAIRIACPCGRHAELSCDYTP